MAIVAPPPMPPRGARGAADLQVVFHDDAILRYYARSSAMVMHCPSAGHGQRCRLTRSVVASARGGRSGQGRPLGLLLAWAGAAGGFPDSAQHVRMQPKPSFLDRQRCRESARGVDDLQPFFAVERDVREGEEDEPEDAV